MKNGCGGSGGFRFRTIIDWIKYCSLFDYKKSLDLYNTIEEKCCDPHDDRFEEGGGIKEFWKANYIFLDDLLAILHWTNVLSRICIFIVGIVSLNLFGIKYFNWKIKWKILN